MFSQLYLWLAMCHQQGAVICTPKRLPCRTRYWCSVWTASSPSSRWRE